MPSEAAGLTHRQQLVWLEQQLAPDVPMNNLVMTFEIEGPLDPARLARAFASVVRDSDALRTVIEEADGAPVQRALAAPPAELETVDLSADPAQLERWLDAFAARPLDLARAAYATAAVKLADARWCWAVVLHHVVGDGRSFEELYERVAQRYLDPDAPAPAAASFADYRAFERAHRGSDAAVASAAFWQQTLGEPEPPAHFYGRPPRAEGPALVRETIEVEPTLRERLEAFAGETLGMAAAPDLAMTALFAALLATFVHGVSGRRRVGIGFPVQNRRTRPQRRTLGLLMEVQVLRLEVDPAESFGSLLRRACATLVGGLRHARYCNADATRHSDVMLNYNPARFPAFAGWSTAASSWSGCTRLAEAAGAGERRASRRPRLVVQVQDFAGRGGHRLDLDLHASAFNAEDRARVPHHLDRLLRAVAAHGDKPIGELAFWDASDRRVLADELARDAAVEAAVEDAAAAFVAPRGELEITVARAWSETLGVDPIGAHDDFFALGGTSFAALELFRRLRAATGVELPLATLFRAPTVARMAERIEEQRLHGAPAWSTLVEIQGRGDLPPLFCAAGAGGNVTNLRRLAQHLGPRQPFYGLQTRGVVGHSEMPHERVEEIARESLADMRRFQPHGPYYLAGYSAGGAVAFEMARMLAREGECVGALLLLDAYAPSIRRRGRAERAQVHWQRLRAAGPRYLVRKLRDRVVGDAMRLRDRVFRLRARLRPELHAQLRFVQQRATIQQLYRPEPAPFAAVLFRVERAAHQIDTRLELDERNGWDRYLLGGVQVVAVPGGHLDMCEEPHVQVLAERVAEALDAARCAAASRADVAA